MPSQRASSHGKPFYSHYLQSILPRFVHPVLRGINIYSPKKGDTWKNRHKNTRAHISSWTNCGMKPFFCTNREEPLFIIFKLLVKTSTRWKINNSTHESFTWIFKFLKPAMGYDSQIFFIVFTNHLNGILCVNILELCLFCARAWYLNK